MSVPKILVFAGSIRTGSFNARLAALAAKELALAGADVTRISLVDYPMPLYDADTETQSGQPENALKLKRMMMTHQGVFIASPEYNASVTPLLKNTIDWLSQDVDGESGYAPFTDKVGGLMGASNGGFGTIRSLPQVSHMLANLGVLMLPVVAVPTVSQAFDLTGAAMTNDRVKKRLTDLGARLARTIVKLA